MTKTKISQLLMHPMAETKKFTKRKKTDTTSAEQRHIGTDKLVG